jgi:hypothetical protein
MNSEVAAGKTFARFTGVAVFSLCLMGTALSQQGGPPPGAGPPANINPNIDARERQDDENRLRGAEIHANTESAREKLMEVAIANMKEDFSRIQILRNDIARNLIAQKPLNYKLLSEQTVEINKRASRLNIYMSGHRAEDEKENDLPELKSEDMVDALVRLCKLIDGFTENPALKNAATVNAKEIDKAKENKANALRDLLAIIKLSGSLQKKSESLRQP